MAPLYEETESILPRNAFIALASTLIATDIFILICTQIEEISTPFWMFTASTVIFAIPIIACYLVKLRISIDDDMIRLRLIKTYEIRLDEIIDYKIGDISIIRNYSGWGLKGVKFKNLICVGYDLGISFKIMGKRVVTISTSDPDAVASFLAVVNDAVV